MRKWLTRVLKGLGVAVSDPSAYAPFLDLARVPLGQSNS